MLLDHKAFVSFVSQKLVFVSAFLLFAILLYYLSPKKRQRLVPGIPIVGGEDRSSVKKSRIRFVHDGKNMLAEGYKKYGGNFFYVPSKLGERLMIPVKYLEDLKAAPIKEVDFVATFIEMFEGQYTTMGSRSTLHPRVVRTQLNKYLSDVMVDVQEEIRDAFEASFPPCEDWTEVDVVDRITQIVARVSSRMFGGTTLSQNNEWVQSSIAFAIDGFIGAQALKKYPEFMKPLIAPFIPAIRAIDKHYKAAQRAAIPLIEQRRRQGSKAQDLLFWMDEQAVNDEKDLKFLAGILLKVSFAAIHTSAAAPTQLLYDLCAMPEYIEPLREEVVAALGPEGMISKQGFHDLSKLDSIMKESQRFNPLLLITFERVVTTDYPLSGGFVIPANTTIGVPTHAISMDPALYEAPKRYDGFRFHKMRGQGVENRQNGANNTNQVERSAALSAYVSSNPTSMAFGYGRHACPGRFFAANEIKAIMAHILLNYDFKFPDGQTQRPESLLFETQYLPNPAGRVMFRRRKLA